MMGNNLKEQLKLILRNHHSQLPNYLFLFFSITFISSRPFRPILTQEVRFPASLLEPHGPLSVTQLKTRLMEIRGAPRPGGHAARQSENRDSNIV